MAKLKNKRTSPRNRSGEYVGFRSPVDLKKKLERAAKDSGRSLSSEAQFRLEKSFNADDIVDRLLPHLKQNYVANAKFMMKRPDPEQCTFCGLGDKPSIVDGRPVHFDPFGYELPCVPFKEFKNEVGRITGLRYIWVPDEPKLP